MLADQAAPAERGALIDGGQKGVAVIARAAISDARGNADETGEVFVFRAQPVIHPGAHAGPDEVRRASVQEERGRPVRDTFRMHGANDAELVHMLGHARE